MNKKVKFIATLFTSTIALSIPISLVATNAYSVEKNAYDIKGKDDQYKYFNPHTTKPSELSRLEVPKWIVQHGKLDAWVVSETFDRVTFGVNLDTNGAIFREGGAFITLFKLDKNSKTYKRMYSSAFYEPNYMYGDSKFNTSAISGYREFSIKKTEADEKYRFQLEVGYEVGYKGEVYTTPSIIAKNDFVVPSFKEPSIKFSMRKSYSISDGYITLENVSDDYFVEWMVHTRKGNGQWTVASSKRIDKVSNIRNKELNFSVNIDRNINQEYVARVLIKDDKDNIIKYIKSEIVTVYGEKDNDKNKGDSNSADIVVTPPGYIDGNRFPKPPFQIC